MATQFLLFDPPCQEPAPCTGEYSVYHTDALEWLSRAAPNSIQAVVTDPPYGLLGYELAGGSQGQEIRSLEAPVDRIRGEIQDLVRQPRPGYASSSAAQTLGVRSALGALLAYFWSRRLVRTVLTASRN